MIRTKLFGHRSHYLPHKKTLASFEQQLYETGQLLEKRTFRSLNLFNDCELAIQKNLTHDFALSTHVKYYLFNLNSRSQILNLNY